MSRNGSGTYTLPSNSFNPAVADTEISETDWNETADDLETAITASIAKDGQTTTTARIPFAAGVLINNTGLNIQDTDASHELTLKPGSNLTADRTLTITTGDADRTLQMAGNLAFAGSVTTSGAFPLTLTVAAATSLSVPSSGMVATRAGSETLSNKTISGGGLLGLGMTPSNIIDVTQTQDAASIAQLLNASNGASASVGYRLKNNANSVLQLNIYGSGVSTSFPITTDGALLSFDGAGGLVLNATTTAGVKLGHASAQVAVTLASGLSVGDGANGAENDLQLKLNGSGYAGEHWLDATAYYIGQNSAGRTLRMFSGTTATTGVELTNGATSWASTSDERKKDIFEPIIDGLEKVCSIRAVIGKYKTDDDGVRRSFLIAQDVQKVLPEAVSEDAEGILSLRYSDVIPLLVSALKDANDRIAALEARAV